MIKMTIKNGKVINRFEVSDIEKVRNMREVLHYSFAKIAKELDCKSVSVCDFYNHKVRNRRS